MIPRRLLLGAALLPAAPAHAATTSLRLRPGGPRLALAVRIEAHPTAREALAIAFTGAGAPEARVLLPSWYGRARVIRALPVAGREVLVAAFEGNRGTGIYQELMAVIGADDAGRLRLLGIETLSFRDQQTSAGWRRMSGRLEEDPGRAGLRLRMSSTARLPRTPPGSERHESWTTRLAWNGTGVLTAPTAPPRAGTVRARVDAARQRIAGLLSSAPVTDATTIDYDATGIWAVGYAEPPP